MISKMKIVPTTYLYENSFFQFLLDKMNNLRSSKYFEVHPTRFISSLTSQIRKLSSTIYASLNIGDPIFQLRVLSEKAKKHTNTLHGELLQIFSCLKAWRKGTISILESSLLHSLKSYWEFLCNKEEPVILKTLFVKILKYSKLKGEINDYIIKTTL